MNINLDGLINAANEYNRAVDGDYIQDGILYCGKCRTPKQCRISLAGTERTVGCLCKCGEKAQKEREDADKSQKRMAFINSLRVMGIADKAIMDYKFSNAELSPLLRKCKAYADNFDRAYSHGSGLLFWGGIGNGKTYSAACIANELIDKGVPVMVTSFPRIINTDYDHRQDMIEQLRHFKLLVIDDLGVERQSEFALETVYTVIDERYKQKQPMIVTTNLSLPEIQRPKDLAYARIYDRLLQMCAPVRFDGQSIRIKKAADNMSMVKEIFGGQA
jgi:DNA replication protein DnaC